MNEFTHPDEFAEAEDLNAAAKSLVFNQARAKRTIKMHKGNWRRFVGFCDAVGLCALPAAPGTIALFIRHMSGPYAPGTIRNHFATISVAHARADLPNPMRSNAIDEAWHDLYEIKDRRQRQAAPINEGLRNRIIALDGEGLADLRDRAMVAAAYDTLGRRRELAALRIEDIVFDPAAPEEGATILLRRSKTDQQGRGRVRFLGPDTLALILAWMEAAAISAGFLFRSVNHRTIGKSISGDAISDAFKKRARMAGEPVEIVAQIGGHSCRVGAAQDMAAAGMSEAAIQQAGGWASREAMLKYIEHIKAKQGGAAQLAARQNRLQTGAAKPTLRLQSLGAIDPALMSRIVAAIAPLANVEAFDVAATESLL